MSKKALEETNELSLQFEKRGGLLPAIAQEAATGEILMIGSVNIEAWEETLKSGMATFWSTSRNELWTKGKTSGDYLEVHEILVDCDQDAVIYKVELKGSGACHTQNKEGNARKSCFYRRYVKEGQKLVFIEK